MYARHPDVIIRREHFGGIAFHRGTGATIELDREACLFLERADGRSIRATSDGICQEGCIQDIYAVADTLLREGFLVKGDTVGELSRTCCQLVQGSVNTELTLNKLSAYPTKGYIGSNSPTVSKGAKNTATKATGWPEKGHLSAPETVHLAITHRCNKSCPWCYVDPVAEEMTTGEVKAIIHEMAEMKVFQLAIGGGEPFLRDDLMEIVRCARQNGIIPNITTNGSLITHQNAARLSGWVGQIQVSVYGHVDRAVGTIKLLKKEKIPFGINVLLSKRNLDILSIINFAARHGASVNFLRPKPSRQRDWYNQSKLSREDYEVIRETLVKARGKYEIKITVDCALSFLMSNEDPKELLRHGIYGCTGARRFLSIHPDGRAYPCSFLDICAGNAKDGLSEVWRAMQSFRSINKRMSGSCGTCTSREFCMGCRAIALHETGDILSDDPGCIREHETLNHAC